MALLEFARSMRSRRWRGVVLVSPSNSPTEAHAPVAQVDRLSRFFARPIARRAGSDQVLSDGEVCSLSLAQRAVGVAAHLSSSRSMFILTRPNRRERFVSARCRKTETENMVSGPRSMTSAAAGNAFTRLNIDKRPFFNRVMFCRHAQSFVADRGADT